ncbi:putative sda1 domain protein [Erysiphe neolycopersici]|uniref:Putative sda1 domain protein n=1 Tax=Erysiphe neolycopersici TaxID=212602 RepID=A0A420HRX0_9PEZI|nr:putative sda1 domain protein [Erysiphe neolycopersici]
MYETSARIGCSLVEMVTVSFSIGELYTHSPEDWTSITVIETISAAGGLILSFFMVPGQNLLSSWADNNLNDNSWITTTPMRYYDNSGPTEP